MEPVLSAAAAAALKSAASETGATAPKLLNRVFGPAADEVGAALGRLTARRLANVASVTGGAAKKQSDNTEGEVPLRAALRIIEDASYSDSEVVAEYLSGILASAKSDRADDDRAVGWSALVGRLSSDQLALHFILYSCIRAALIGEQERSARDLCEEQIFIPYDVLEPMAHDDESWSARFTDAFYGLYREGLIGEYWQLGCRSSFKANVNVSFQRPE